MTREIAEKDWPAFCRMISAKYQGAIVNVQVVNARIEKIVDQVPLLELVLDERTDACSNRLTVATASLQHEIVEPIRMILRKTAGHEKSESYQALEIPAESGTTVVSFHPGIATKDLDEL
jgi:hypothetical protein